MVRSTIVQFLVMYSLYHVVGAVYDVTFGFKEGEPSILGVMNAEPCQVDMLIR